LENNNYTINKSQKGFALPSVLFLVTILSLLAASVIMLHYFLRQTSLIEVAKVKAEYAAESGIAKIISQLKSGSNLTQMSLSGLIKNYQFEDGSEANTEAKSWGAYLVVKSDNYTLPSVLGNACPPQAGTLQTSS
jgi:Tfp pilus assembly protein PilX